MAGRTKNNGATLDFQSQLWAAADKLRGHMDASEYKHVVLGLIFLKYISDSFEEVHAQLLNQNLPDLGADSAVPGLNRNIAYMSDVIFPPQKIMKEFDDFAKSLFDKISANEEESRTLASLRDSLLPKLMRGEVRVKDVERG